MPKESIKQVLIRRDSMPPEDADKLIEEAKEALQLYLLDEDIEPVENVCEEFFGLEPDYLIELM